MTKLFAGVWVSLSLAVLAAPFPALAEEALAAPAAPAAAQGTETATGVEETVDLAQVNAVIDARLSALLRKMVEKAQTGRTLAVVDAPAQAR